MGGWPGCPRVLRKVALFSSESSAGLPDPIGGGVFLFSPGAGLHPYATSATTRPAAAAAGGVCCKSISPFEARVKSGSQDFIVGPFGCPGASVFDQRCWQAEERFANSRWHARQLQDDDVDDDDRALFIRFSTPQNPPVQSTSGPGGGGAGPGGAPLGRAQEGQPLSVAAAACCCRTSLPPTSSPFKARVKSGSQDSSISDPGCPGASVFDWRCWHAAAKLANRDLRHEGQLQDPW